jgi:hypothetical protein
MGSQQAVSVKSHRLHDREERRVLYPLSIQNARIWRHAGELVGRPGPCPET